MRTDRLKQVRCISETTAAAFEDKINEVLANLGDPEIRIDTNMPFTAYIIYSVQRDLPETILEMFELVDGESHFCKECPHFLKSTDKRKKWGTCVLKSAPSCTDSRACEEFYLYRFQLYKEAEKKYTELPFTAESTCFMR